VGQWCCVRCEVDSRRAWIGCARSVHASHLLTTGNAQAMHGQRAVWAAGAGVPRFRGQSEASALPQWPVRASPNAAMCRRLIATVRRTMPGAAFQFSCCSDPFLLPFGLYWSIMLPDLKVCGLVPSPMRLLIWNRSCLRRSTQLPSLSCTLLRFGL
jgi:hypothetical protein